MTIDADLIAEIAADMRVYPPACTITREDESVEFLEPTLSQRRIGNAWVKNNWLYVNKYRQAKATTYVAMCVLGMVMVTDGIQGVIMANDKPTALSALGRAITAYMKLPPEIRIPLFQGEEPAQGKIIFTHKGAVQAMTSGGDTPGMGFSFDRVHVTEYGEYADVEAFHTHFLPAVNKRPNAKVCIESTPGLWQSVQHRLWMDSLEGKTRFKPLFLRWWLDDSCRRVDKGFRIEDFQPTLDELRYAETLMANKEIPEADMMQRLAFRRLAIDSDFFGDPALFSHKYPGHSRDGWVHNERPAIPKDALDAFWAVALKDIDYSGSDKAPVALREVSFFEHPDADTGSAPRYLITSDPAGYGEMGDPSSLHVWDMLKRRDVAAWAGRTDPNTHAKRIKEIQDYYGAKRTYICVESNKGEVLAALINMEVPNLHYYKQDHPGLHANEVTNKEAHEALVNQMRKGDLQVRSMETLHQLSAWDGKSRAKRSHIVGGTHHFDRAVSCRVAAWMFQHSRFSGIREKKEAIEVRTKTPEPATFTIGPGKAIDAFAKPVKRGKHLGTPVY